MVETTLNVNHTHLSIPTSYRQPSRLDWAKSSWRRWIHVLLWSWLNPIFRIGSKRHLTDHDLFDLPQEDECHQLMKKIEKVWNTHESKDEHINVWQIIVETFWKECFKAALILFLYMAAQIAQPICLKYTVQSIIDLTEPSYVGYLFAIGLGLSTAVQAVIHQQFFFSTVRVGTHTRIALTSIIYQKLLALPASALIKTTTGQMIHLISNDLSKFEELSIGIHHLWAAPLQALIVFGLIWNEIGIPTVFGYSVLLLLGLLQIFFSKRFGTYRKSTVQWSDQRIKVINEFLVNCQIVKMYRWEESLEDLVYHARKNELESIRKASRIKAINMGTFFLSLPLISLATFGGSWLMSQTLSPAKIFTVVSFFSIIRFPLTDLFPYAIEKLSESMIAARSVDQFVKLGKKTCRTNNYHHGSGTVLISGASFTWGSTRLNELSDISLNIPNGSLVGVIGPTGSSKSSLLTAILGEMILIEGHRHVDGRVAYVSQTPWIFAGTIRENILFYQVFDQQKYDRVLRSCQLMADLRCLPAGDSTVINENGVNLSGGQKARISLARALYAEADIYLFDDPLAALDPNVAKKIFRACFSDEGMLRKKTRILVTHQIQYLSSFHHCILMDRGKIAKQGSFNDLLSIDRIKSQYEKQRMSTNKTQQASEQNDQNMYTSTNQFRNIDRTNRVQEETSMGQTISAHVWWKLFTSSHGWTGFFLLILVMLFGECLYDATNKWLSIWSSKIEVEQRENYYPSIYLALVISTMAFALIRADYFFHLILSGATVLHNRMFKSVLYSSLRFHELNPTGRILNRFSKDQQVIDELLPTTFYDTIQSLVMVFGSIVIIGMGNPWVLLILIPIVPIFLWLRKFYLKTSRDLKLLESTTRSPIFALFSSSLTGVLTIRSFNVQDYFVKLYTERVNANLRALFLFQCSGRWFGLRLDLMTCCLTFLTAILSVALRKNIDASAVALGLSYCISLTALFQWGVRQSAETENYMTSTERIDEYGHIPAELGFLQGESQPSMDWPSEGKIQFQNYKLKYRPELHYVLNGINLNIAPRTKIGIIGRTGAGKSSIFQALFRFIESSMTDGNIYIDGVDIQKISLNHLRSIFTIIPQFPVLFSDTLRYNLDPFASYTDEQLWQALESVQLKTKISNLNDKLNTTIAEHGSNFSVGERQLICIARALLKPSKILLMDEATGHIDSQTDQLIQQILREKFMNHTRITITHRFNTILDHDQIFLLKGGIMEPYEISKRKISNESNSHVNNDNNPLPSVST